MITEDYVSYETAKLLKEKGFNEECFMFWRYGKANDKDDTDGISLSSWNENDSNRVTNSELDEYFNDKLSSEGYSAPTIQMVIKWLEVEHRLLILKDYVNVVGNIIFLYQLSVVKIKEDGSIDDVFESYCVHDKDYNNGCNRIIKHCLKYLI